MEPAGLTAVRRQEEMRPSRAHFGRALFYAVAAYGIISGRNCLTNGGRP